jgi:hypothetical protein
MSEAPNRYHSERHHPIGATLDKQGISYQDSVPTELNHSKQDYRFYTVQWNDHS